MFSAFLEGQRNLHRACRHAAKEPVGNPKLEPLNVMMFADNQQMIMHWPVLDNMARATLQPGENTPNIQTWDVFNLNVI